MEHLGCCRPSRIEQIFLRCCTMPLCKTLGDSHKTKFLEEEYHVDNAEQTWNVDKQNSGMKDHIESASGQALECNGDVLQ